MQHRIIGKIEICVRLHDDMTTEIRHAVASRELIIEPRPGSAQQTVVHLECRGAVRAADIGEVIENKVTRMAWKELLRAFGGFVSHHSFAPHVNEATMILELSIDKVYWFARKMSATSGITITRVRPIPSVA